MSGRVVGVLLGVALLGGGGLYLVSEAWGGAAPARGHEPEVAALPGGVQRPPADAQPVRAAPRPEKDRAGAPGYLELPDGRFLPALNGVRAADKLAWSGAEFPVIEAVVRNPADGLEWYRLENGDMLTTVNAPGTEGGRAVRRDLIVYVQRKDLLPVRPGNGGRYP